ncbi:hypothetical protein [Riemerella columbipharyngis]|uniref:hypothetical protein n=1 Tax=Riemerella columbipharyngis TaxID=1071918 RepID=UPI0015A1D59C|nr:hypothetical protein [Riemerella columbipharyngis]
MYSEGVSPKSVFYYAKIKGLLEETVIKREFGKTIILNLPPLIRENTDKKLKCRVS